jgi:hypothetical protein
VQQVAPEVEGLHVGEKPYRAEPTTLAVGRSGKPSQNQP